MIESKAKTFAVNDGDQELQRVATVHASNQCASYSRSRVVLDLVERTSNWQRACRILCIVRVIVERRHEFWKKEAKELLDCISLSDEQSAALHIVHVAQQESFQEEIELLRAGKSVPK